MEWRRSCGLIVWDGEIEYLGFGWSAINHRTSGEPLADWRQGKARCYRVPVRLFVLFAYGVVDGFGGSQAVDRARCGEREQHYLLRHRHADGTAWVYSGQSVLYRGVRGQYSFVGEDGDEFVVFPLVTFRIKIKQIVRAPYPMSAGALMAHACGAQDDTCWDGAPRFWNVRSNPKYTWN
jgi:hypothetical protein